MRTVLAPIPIRAPAPRYVPARRRRRCDSAEFSLGGDAYVVVPGLDRQPPGLALRLAEWSRRVRRLLGEAGFRVVATLALAGWSWVCERGGA